ncbi:hypothetical protein F4819DRAFT_452527 [Hypoxylon fuscum]|nr:hypothetical protein F4819DRAFT_452527 [Hypoxylon fuscum]
MLALITLVNADGPTCETTQGSPWALDCNAALDKITEDIGDIVGNEDCILPNSKYHGPVLLT